MINSHALAKAHGNRVGDFTIGTKSSKHLGSDDFWNSGTTNWSGETHIDEDKVCEGWCFGKFCHEYSNIPRADRLRITFGMNACMSTPCRVSLWTEFCPHGWTKTAILAQTNLL